MKYTVKKINDYTYAFNDDLFCTVYLIIGDNKVLLIDAGIAENTDSLLNNVRKITDKDIIVALTHSHYDHIGHLNEFDSFYVSYLEMDNIIKNNLDSKAILLTNNNIFDLGGIKVKAIITPGHTKGSTIFIDENAKIAYTGDQFGSGCGVWMQVDAATSLSTYIENIDCFLNYLSSYDFDLSNWVLYGGHLGQETTGRLGYNPLNIEMIKNLKVLSGKLINNEVELLDSNAKMYCNEKSYYASYKNAEMIIRKSLIK